MQSQLGSSQDNLTWLSFASSKHVLYQALAMETRLMFIPVVGLLLYSAKRYYRSSTSVTLP